MKEGDFLSNDYDNETFGWLRSIIQRVNYFYLKFIYKKIFIFSLLHKMV
jgi:hypothetical protein